MKKILFYLNAFFTMTALFMTLVVSYIIGMKGFDFINGIILALFVISTILLAIITMYCEETT